MKNIILAVAILTATSLFAKTETTTTTQTQPSLYERVMTGLQNLTENTKKEYNKGQVEQAAKQTKASAQSKMEETKSYLQQLWQDFKEKASKAFETQPNKTTTYKEKTVRQ